MSSSKYTENLSFYEESTLHGVKYVKNSKTLAEKIFWITTICISFGVCVVLTYIIYQKRINNPVIISFDEKPTPIWEIPFPAVTICPETKTKASVLNFTRVFYEVEQKNFANLTEEELKYVKVMVQLCDGDHDTLGIKTKEPDLEDVKRLREMAPSLNETVGYCRFRDYYVNCTDRIAEMITDEGVCFTFNSLDGKELFKTNGMAPDFSFYNIGKSAVNWTLDDGYTNDEYENQPERGYVSGYKHGFSVVLMQHKDNFDYKCRGVRQGYRVILHNPASQPRGIEDHIKIQFGSETTVKVEPALVKTDPSLKNYRPENRKCFYADERPLRFFKIYTKSNCEIECLSNYTLAKCGCVRFDMPREEGTTVCNIDQYECYLIALYDNWDLETWDEGEAEFEHKNFTQDCNCLPTCTELTYRTDISQVAFDSVNFLAEAKEKLNNSENLQFAKLDVFFKVSKFVAIKRSELYSNTDFLANFGGLIGMLLGASLLSIMEIIYFCIIHLISYTKARPNSETNESKTSSQGNIMGLQRYSSNSHENASYDNEEHTPS